MDLIEKTLSQLGDLELHDSLDKHTTLRIGGKANYVLYPKHFLALSHAIDFLVQQQVPFKLLGKGSNILCGDQDYEGCIIKLDRYFNDFFFQNDELYAMSGCSIIALSHEAMKHSMTGLEFASGIPATLGGTIYMNAGAYKASMKDIVQRVLVYRHHDFEWVEAGDLDFDYRHSIFHLHSDWVIVAAQLKLQLGQQEVIRELMQTRRERRMDTQPLEYPSAGSVFRNIKDKAAWQYISDGGLRGYQVGGAKISEKHTNFIINEGSATAKDFLAVVKQVQAVVKEKYNEEMIMEVEIFNCQ